METKVLLLHDFKARLIADWTSVRPIGIEVDGAFAAFREQSCPWVERRGRTESRGLSQAAAAGITGMTQPKVSQIRRYKLQNISLERLMQALVSFDQQVEIVVRPARTANAAGITVAAGR